MTPEEFREHGHAMIDWIADYVDDAGSRPVFPDIEPGDIRRQLAEHPPGAPQPFADVFADLENVIVPGLTQWQHPDFFAWFPSNITYPSILGELMSAGLGINAMAWVTSPAATELETLMLDWMHELLGLPDHFRSTSDTGGGVIQGTASESTLTAMLAARWRATGGDINASGDTTKLVGYTTSQSHSSIEKGFRIAGIGTDNMRIVPHDEHFAMRPDAFADLVTADIAAGLTPFFVVTSPGTTSSLAFDPTPAIATVARDPERVEAVVDPQGAEGLAGPRLLEQLPGAAAHDRVGQRPLPVALDGPVVLRRRRGLPSRSVRPIFQRNAARILFDSARYPGLRAVLCQSPVPFWSTRNTLPSV